MNAKQTFGRNLRFLRTLSGLTIVQVANKLDLDRTRYNFWEIGKSAPSYDNLIRLSELFGASIDDMLKVNMAANALSAIRAGVKSIQNYSEPQGDEPF